MVLSSWQATSRVHPAHMMNVERHQAAANPQHRPTNPGCESACRLPECHTHHHLLLLLSQKADTHFTIPWRIEG